MCLGCVINFKVMTQQLTFLYAFSAYVCTC
jgi:hypothetical protein